MMSIDWNLHMISRFQLDVRIESDDCYYYARPIFDSERPQQEAVKICVCVYVCTYMCVYVSNVLKCTSSNVTETIATFNSFTETDSSSSISNVSRTPVCRMCVFVKHDFLIHVYHIITFISASMIFGVIPFIKIPPPTTTTTITKRESLMVIIITVSKTRFNFF